MGGQTASLAHAGERWSGAGEGTRTLVKEGISPAIQFLRRYFLLFLYRRFGRIEPE